MNKFYLQSQKNEELYNILQAEHPDDFNDWKITLLFYSALHLLKALASQKGKLSLIGTKHQSQLNSISPKSFIMPFSHEAHGLYRLLMNECHAVRYSGYIQESFYETNLKNKLKKVHGAYFKFKKYIIEIENLKISE